MRRNARRPSKPLLVAGYVRSSTEEQHLGPEAMLLRGIVVVFAQHQRALSCARTKGARGVNCAHGERGSGVVPYVSRLAADALHLKGDEAEPAVVALTRFFRTDGRTLRAIAEELGAPGIAPRPGGAWHPQAVPQLVASAEAA